MRSEVVQARLAELRRDIRRGLPAAPTKPISPARRADLERALLGFAKIVAMVALPFVLYVRAAVYLSQRSDASPWVAVAAAAVLTAIIVAGSVTWALRRLSGRARAASVARWVAVPLTTMWCLYAAFFIARANAKSDAVREYYSAVHPVLRVALATVILADPDLVITDAKRVAADYVRMGLPVNDRTLHYGQHDGWVHAVDLRTRDRSEVKNRLVQGYFEVMGFSTLRHVGTADHLHVQLRRN
jgi:hypothetical protein